MKEYFICFGICLSFILSYELIVLRGRRLLMIFFALIEILLVCSLMKSFYIGIEDFAGVCTLQVFFLVFIRNHIKNTSKKKIYDIAADIPFTLVIFSGLRNLSEKEYEKIYEVIHSVLAVDICFQKTVFLICSYSKKELIISYLFRNKEDYYLYQQKELLEMNCVEEAKEIGKGASMVYKVGF